MAKLKPTEGVTLPPDPPAVSDAIRRDWAEANLGGTGGGVPAEVDGGPASSVCTTGD